MIKKCVICGKEFDAYKTAKTCSKKCSRELKRLNNKRYWSNKSKSTTKNHSKKEPVKKTCLICGKEFWTTRSCQKFCSNKCREEEKIIKRRKQRKPRGGARQLKEKGSLCWRCKHAVPSPIKKTGCSWSIGFNPIPGWEAKEVFSVRDGEKVPCGYMVKSCPLFEEEF